MRISYLFMTVCLLMFSELTGATSPDWAMCGREGVSREQCGEFTEYRRVTTECTGKRGDEFLACVGSPYKISDDDPEYQALLKKYGVTSRSSTVDSAPKPQFESNEPSTPIRDPLQTIAVSDTSQQRAGGAGRAAFATFLSGAIGLLFGYGFFKFTAKSAAGNSPNATGLKLCRWVVFFACIKTSNDILGPFFSGVSHRHDVLFVLFMDIVGFGVWALVAYAAGFAYAKVTGRNDVQKVGTAPAGFTPSSALVQPKSAIPPTVSEDDLFAAVAKELMHNQRDEGLWTKAFALENGDDRKTKAHYIRLRVESLKNGSHCFASRQPNQ